MVNLDLKIEDLVICDQKAPLSRKRDLCYHLHFDVKEIETR